MSALPIQLIVGLGNPGAEYDRTRHNAGYWFVDMLARRQNETFKTESRFHGQICRVTIADRDCRLLKPLTFMNRSGQAVARLAAYFKIDPEEILVAHDELDLPAGVVRLRQGGGGHAGHNGLRDIVAVMGSNQFHRLRIGIGRPVDRQPGANYVLNRPSPEDGHAIIAALDRAADSLPEIAAGEFQRAMNRLHSLP